MGRRSAAARLTFHFDGEPKGRAITNLTLYTHHPAHHFYNLLADDQSESRSSEPPRRGIIGLAERGKDSRLGVPTQPDTRIGDLEAQADFSLRLARHRDGHRNFSGLGELNRVA